MLKLTLYIKFDCLLSFLSIKVSLFLTILPSNSTHYAQTDLFKLQRNYGITSPFHRWMAQ